MVWALVFWFLISAAKVAFVYFFSIVLSNICQQINEIIQKTAEFDFMKLVNFALNPIFLGVIGGWILLGIIGAIVLVSIAHARNKNQQKWIKAYMKADMPSEEYYDEDYRKKLLEKRSFFLMRNAECGAYRKCKM
jgi:hypothetical protein